MGMPRNDATSRDCAFSNFSFYISNIAHTRNHYKNTVSSCYHVLSGEAIKFSRENLPLNGLFEEGLDSVKACFENT